MKRVMSNSRRLRRFASLLLLGCLGSAGLASCGPELSTISKISTLRLLAVRKTAPYARPGEIVEMEMFWEGADSRDVERFFAFFCVNPPGDAYAGCFQGLPGVVPRVVLNEDRFSFRMPDDILKEPVPGTGTLPTGSAFVFYGVCRGRLQSGGQDLAEGLGGQGGQSSSAVGGAGMAGGPSSALGGAGGSLEDRNDLPPGQLVGLPECVDERGEAVGSDGYVIGYSQVFAYEQLRNKNPILTGFQVNDRDVAPECLDSECIGRPFSFEDEGACSEGEACFDVCPPEPTATCPSTRIEAVVDRASAEDDEASNVAFGGNLQETLWVSYFVSDGALTNELRLVNDATRGWNEDLSTSFSSPKKSGPVGIWAVVRDNRGGVSFGRLRGYVQENE